MHYSCFVPRASWIARALIPLALLAHLPTGPLTAQERAVPLDRDGFVRVFNAAGSIRVIGWGVDSVRWGGELARGQELYGGGNRRMVKLGPNGADGPARLEVRVPHGAKVVIDAGESTVDVDGLTGPVEIRGGAGNVHVSGAPVRLTIETVDGDVDITGGPHRSLDVRTAGGEIQVTGARGEVTISSVSGAITLQADSITRGHVTSVEGTVRMFGTVDRTGTLNLESHGGDIDLTLITRPGFDLVATAIGGSITNTLSRSAPRPIRDGRGFLLETAVGDGSGTVTVTAFKGTIRLYGK
jgi:hypothetical protein